VLVRQKTILSLLKFAHKPLSATVFVKLMFLLREETDLQNNGAFYDFLPYHYGPFSFALYRELGDLRQNGYLTAKGNRVELSRDMLASIEEKVEELPCTIRQAVTGIIDRYGGWNQGDLIADVYARYPWYATNSQLIKHDSTISSRQIKPALAVYTTGYQGKSVDSFFNGLMKRGINAIIDVRANPVSRKYGFSLRRLTEITKKLDLTYYHVPSLGVPSKLRSELDDYDSYKRLLNLYEKELLKTVEGDITKVGQLMRERPSILMCFEKDVRYCHRSRLAEAVSRSCGLQVVHL
jgi:uncharacterized protein (DUF488 family)